MIYRRTTGNEVQFTSDSVVGGIMWEKLLELLMDEEDDEDYRKFNGNQHDIVAGP